MRFNVSDRVILDNVSGIELGKYNPLWGSEYQSIGTITKTYEYGANELNWVKWDNGISNSYGDDLYGNSYLSLYKENMLPEELFEL
jgi:hypothetical protein